MRKFTINFFCINIVVITILFSLLYTAKMGNHKSIADIFLFVYVTSAGVYYNRVAAKNKNSDRQNKDVD
jgi:hypothetical protein